ncbi:hypothetical protein O4G98_10545 [Zoogloeaceae bacterium G21618-S1]|nr:hypothetical protein [Zoogloeaceae bacterium G21618-S1]
MIAPLIRLFIREPELLAEHLSAYLELTRADLRRFISHLRRQIALLCLAAAGGLIGSVLGGVAALLWAAQHEAHWVFFAVPLVPLVLTSACVVGLYRFKQSEDPLARLCKQVDADLKVIGGSHDANATEHESSIGPRADGRNAS